MKNKLISAVFSLVLLGASHGLKAQLLLNAAEFNAYTDTGAWAPRYLQAAPYNTHIDPSLIRASKIAEQRAGRHSVLLCWRYVKAALVDSGAVHSRPTSAYAYEAATELVARNGFVKLPVNDPYRAPVGSVLVYSGHGAGHVELRTAHGFASDYRSLWACRYHLIGVYAKMAS